MSQNVSPSKARLFLDGDGWRAPLGTELPANPFAVDLADPFQAFGGIEAGFLVGHERSRTSKTIWNSDGEYKTSKGARITTARLKAVDMSEATVRTILRGGSIVQVTDEPPVYRWDEADTDEEFAALLVGREGDEAVAYWIARAVLNNDPDENVNDDDLYGFDLEIKGLTPDGGGPAFVRYTTSSPFPTAPAV